MRPHLIQFGKIIALRREVSATELFRRKVVLMPAKSPEEICSLYQKYMREGDIDKVLTVYDADGVFLNQSRELKKGKELSQELASFAAGKATFDFNVLQVIQSGDIALMPTRWKVSLHEELSVQAIEVARRQPDGTSRWLIGGPFTVGRQTPSEQKVRSAQPERARDCPLRA